MNNPTARISEDELIEIKSVPNTEEISKSLKQFNYNYTTLYLCASAIEETYNTILFPMVDYYIKNSEILYDSQFLFQQNVFQWLELLTIVQLNSSKWIKPMTVFYPTLIQDPVNENDITNINNWLKKYFPIKNNDNTLNYVENQKFIVNCYTYEYAYRTNVLDQPYSYCNCTTYSGLITLHCQTKITGGWIECHQGSYNCNRTINCYPKLNVDCWYESPYLHTDSRAILPTDPVSTKQSAISKIQANLTMDYIDRRENSIRSFVFIVRNCDWLYTGERIN
jgi:hypothetical protein